MSDLNAFRVAIIGAGPAGFYTAESLLKADENATIDIFDRLPTPYGLVRYGVAPDHHRIKSVAQMLARTGRHERVRFLGNVEYGRDLQLTDLLAHYHAVVFAVGAPLDRGLGIPGEELPGSMSATEFVAWYNGHPDYAHLQPDLSAETAVVVGLGNVAVDVTRILAKSADELRATDIASYALEQLAESRIRDVILLGRRGPAQARFTTKELRELGELDNADIIVEPAELELDLYSRMEADSDRNVQRNLQVLEEFRSLPRAGKPRRVHLRFLRSPVRVEGTGRMERLRLERNELVGAPGLGMSAVGTGQFEEIGAGLLFRSVGYRGTALPDVPFDPASATIPNSQGRVLTGPGGQPVPGLYAVGWIKRGPSGVIGSNKADGIETAASIMADSRRQLEAGAADPAALDRLLKSRSVEPVSFPDWEQLDRLELERGAASGRPREKLTNLKEMLAAIRQPA